MKSKQVSSNLTVTIRPMHLNDYESVMKLWIEAGLPCKPHGRDSRKKLAEQLESERTFFYVAEDDKNIVGVVLGTHDGRKGWVNRLAVHSDCRRLGLAGRLVQHVEQALKQCGIEIFACLIEEANEASLKFFRQAGYKVHRDIIYCTKKNNPEV